MPQVQTEAAPVIRRQVTCGRRDRRHPRGRRQIGGHFSFYFYPRTIHPHCWSSRWRMRVHRVQRHLWKKLFFSSKKSREKAEKCDTFSLLLSLLFWLRGSCGRCLISGFGKGDFLHNCVYLIIVFHFFNICPLMLYRTRCVGWLIKDGLWFRRKSFTLGKRFWATGNAKQQPEMAERKWEKDTFLNQKIVLKCSVFFSKSPS